MSKTDSNFESQIESRIVMIRMLDVRDHKKNQDQKALLKNKWQRMVMKTESAENRQKRR